MEKQHDIDQNRILTILTAFSTFLMGFIDAYTFIIRDGVFASAQTGNMVVLVAKLFGGHFWEAMIHVSAFIGFALGAALGAFFGQAIIEHFKEHDWKKYRIYLLIQAIFLLFIALIQQHIGPSYWPFLNWVPVGVISRI
ncbi:hypothetical protein ACA29_14180 [Lederbergia galactosidilytica]|uniref:DUF1275 domain-containing protein n=1 Tax=Lederbergia galactosidilytica TaxID=217031 RepID=A0A0Q9Y8E7_9BACI|nr:hypothetical protein ACA29_14180 [Lederbergia galactosidilytica]